jgi:hypothetical protein
MDKAGGYQNADFAKVEDRDKIAIAERAEQSTPRARRC